VNAGLIFAVLLFIAQAAGIINGRIVDDTGAAIPGAKVTLSLDDGLSPAVEVLSRADGQFSFSNIPAGPFHLAMSAPGFADQTLAGILAAGDVSNLPPTRMILAVSDLAVDVTSTRVALAQKQIEEQEQQRVLGVIPNFFVTYNPDAVPLTPKQKFELTWKARLDLFQFVAVAITAGVQQARNDFSGFGDGPEGYAKRYAAAYANGLTRSLITQSLLPSVFRQDPRYFHKGTGSTASRAAYALSSAVVTKGDNGHWQPNYSVIFGGLASGAISNLYYPAEDRKGVQLTLENAAIGIGGLALGRVAQEFLFNKLTTRAHASKP
jgi:Carboxypeptidase regulatory-like domain